MQLAPLIPGVSAPRVKILHCGLRFRAWCALALAWGVLALGPAGVALAPDVKSRFGLAWRAGFGGWFRRKSFAELLARIMCRRPLTPLALHDGVKCPLALADCKGIVCGLPELRSFRIDNSRLGLAWRAGLGRRCFREWFCTAQHLRLNALDERGLTSARANADDSG